MEPVGVPTGADGRVGGDETARVRVVDERLGEQRKAHVVERQHALVAQFHREGRGPRAVLGLHGVRQASRVVDEPEAEHERGVDLADRRCERHPRRRDATPVRVAVNRRLGAPRPRQHDLDEGG